MGLAEFIKTNTEQILREWEGFAKNLAGDVPLSRWVLRDHAAAIIKYIAESMEQPQLTSEEIAKAQGAGPSGPIERVAAVHVGLRVESGFDLVQIIAEYRALRSGVLRLWRISSPEGFAAGAAEIVRFGEAIDQNIAEAIPSYEEREIRYRDRFLGILGHDLRNPINSISAGASLLATQGLSEPQQGTITRIQRSTQRLNLMVTDLLDFARGRLGSPMPLTVARASLAAPVQEVVNEVRATHPEIELRFDADGDLSGTWDAERIKQMASNLLMNAVQHGSGKQVTIAARGDQDSVLLEVHNDGPPIARELIATIFDPLVQGGDPDRERTGLGLGLFIVKEIVSAHGGTVTVNSTQDAGTTFSVRLPRLMA
ncbi:MAG: HAMP domain-containing histidine kinase [Candidatus Binataceae bacterium]|nr:HAMP domain-containing histidine kinase [Candidatus Binataceae bacterium]